jgi:hypothetical protein
MEKRNNFDTADLEHLSNPVCWGSWSILSLYAKIFYETLECSSGLEFLTKS